MAARGEVSCCRSAVALATAALSVMFAMRDPVSTQHPTVPPGASRDLTDTLIASGPHPSLSTEARLFGRFVGSWDCEYSFRADNGSVRYASGEVTFGWIIDGWAVQDTWISYPPDRRPEGRNIGTTIRFFDTKARKWKLVFISPAQNAVTTLEGGLEGDRIVFRGTDADGSLLRWSFNELRPESFVWRGEVSRDDGKTWRLEEEHRMTRQGSK
jgi:hypothetical protein